MITEDFVSFEVAKLLKEKGFDWECLGTYSTGDKELSISSECPYSNDLNDDMFIAAPTLQMAMKWLREVHHYIIEIHYGNVGSLRKPEMQWWWELENKQGEFLDGNITDGNTTYEAACEAAIKYCLTNLI